MENSGWTEDSALLLYLETGTKIRDTQVGSEGGGREVSGCLLWPFSPAQLLRVKFALALSLLLVKLHWLCSHLGEDHIGLTSLFSVRLPSPATSCEFTQDKTFLTTPFIPQAFVKCWGNMAGHFSELAVSYSTCRS